MVIIDEDIQSLLNDGEVVRVEPVEEQVYVFMECQGGDDAFQDVEKLEDCLSETRDYLQLVLVLAENIFDDVLELLQVNVNVLSEVLMHPKGSQNFEELLQVLQIWIIL